MDEYDCTDEKTTTADANVELKAKCFDITLKSHCFRLIVCIIALFYDLKLSKSFINASFLSSEIGHYT